MVRRAVTVSYVSVIVFRLPTLSLYCVVASTELPSPHYGSLTIQPSPRHLPERKPPGLSASELLERMEQDIVAVDKFEQGRRDGAEALLDAIRTRPVILRLDDVSEQTIRKAA